MALSTRVPANRECRLTHFNQCLDHRRRDSCQVDEKPRLAPNRISTRPSPRSLKTFSTRWNSASIPSTSAQIETQTLNPHSGAANSLSPSMPPMRQCERLGNPIRKGLSSMWRSIILSNFRETVTGNEIWGRCRQQIRVLITQRMPKFH
jgi:hypothetical protein